MKSKKLLFSAFLGLSALTSYIVLTSSATASQGVMGASTIGCGSCHGSANATTSITITGIPASGWIAGNLYNLSVKVSNASKLAAGFDMSITAGTLSNAPVNTMLMGGAELHHTAPLMMTGGEAVWNFDWTAPASGSSVTFHVAGNAVNNNSSDSGDQWSKVSLTHNKAIPAAIRDIEETSLHIFPNPCTNYMTVNSTESIDLNSLYAISINGSTTKVNALQTSKNEYNLETKALSSGNYILMYMTDGKVNHVKFTKN